MHNTEEHEGYFTEFDEYRVSITNTRTSEY